MNDKGVKTLFKELNRIKKKNSYFNPNFKPVQCLNKISPQMPHATFVTYVPVLCAEQLQFPCWVIFNDSAQTGLQWCLLILQTVKASTKKGNLFVPKTFF